MQAVALHPRATTIPTAPLCIPSLRRFRSTAVPRLLFPHRTPEVRWLNEQIEHYRVLRAYWTDLFWRQHIKIYVSWYKHDAAHCTIADALEELGGVAAIYQRSYELFPTPETATAADVVFVFSPLTAEMEQRTSSSRPYYVTTGYIGDHRFAPLRTQAAEARERLARHGATHVFTFFDENSSDDSRWQMGHAVMREHYAFLFDKVLSETWLGLILKPKVPSTLRRRLGPLAESLDRALATGRCVVYEGGAILGSHPPAAAALAADIAIHGHLFAVTAGVESALTGTPTLLMDREGWSISPLYRLGVGRVVFTDWPSLWKACREHWTWPSGIPGFGDWTPLLNELDPFQDGRAGERMGTYLLWLLEALKAGLDREAALTQASERYTTRWGVDKVVIPSTVHPRSRKVAHV